MMEKMLSSSVGSVGAVRTAKKEESRVQAANQGAKPQRAPRTRAAKPKPAAKLKLSWASKPAAKVKGASLRDIMNAEEHHQQAAAEEGSEEEDGEE